jgi:preprotein translocase subunit SecG
MYVLLMLLVVVICVLLGAIVLIQNPKGGGLTSNFSSQSQLMGVQKTGDFLEKGTWILAIALMVLSLVINVSVKGTGTSKNAIDQATQKTMDKVDKQAAPAAAPATTPAPPINLPQKKGK